MEMTVKIECWKCGRLNEVEDEKCWKCKREITDEERQAAIANEQVKIDEENKRQADELNKGLELLETAKLTDDWSEVPPDIILNESKKIICTTSFTVANRDIQEEVEIITAECVFGMNIFRDVFAAIRDIVGGRSGAVQQILRDARRTVMSELRREAFMVGADAVIAIDLDYQELSGGHKGGMLMIVASGTAVKLNNSP